jgi:hypothetical protein
MSLGATSLLCKEYNRIEREGQDTTASVSACSVGCTWLPFFSNFNSVLEKEMGVLFMTLGKKESFVFGVVVCFFGVFVYFVI